MYKNNIKLNKFYLIYYYKEINFFNEIKFEYNCKNIYN